MFLSLVCGSLMACSDADSETSETVKPTPVFASTRWAVTLGGVSADGATAVATDASGDVIAAGSFTGSVNFGKTTQVSTTAAAWISKRSAVDGAEQWTVVLPPSGGGTVNVSDLASTSDGVLVLGTYSGESELDIGGVRLGPKQDCFVAKLSPTGAVNWVRHFGQDTGALCGAVAASPDGRFAVLGAYTGTLHAPSGDIVARHIDLFLEAFSADGQARWAVTNANPDVVTGMTPAGLAVTSEGDIIISGAIGFPMVFNRAVLEPEMRPDQYVARFTDDGRMMWARVAGETKEQRTAGPIAIDSKGGVVLTSSRSKPNILGEGVPVTERYDPAGGRTWEHRSGFVHSSSLVVTTIGDVLVTGGRSPSRSLEFGTGHLDGCFYLLAQDAEGRVLDALAYDDPDACSSRWFADLTAGKGTVVWVGNVGAPVNVGTGTLRHAGQSDAVIVMTEMLP